MLHRIQIKSPTPHDNGLAHTANGTEVLVDGKPFHGIRSISTDHAVDSVPSVVLEVIPSAVDVDTCADMQLSVDIHDVRTAVECLQLQMKLDTEFRDAVISDIGTVLEEHAGKYIKTKKLATMILERIFGFD